MKKMSFISIRIILLVCWFYGQFYWWRKPEDLEKTINLSQVT